ncbi:MAG: hypothetical protein IPP71_15185 [Bacteroidetes bacterium]|nr:hypothetical protein [Bacteroidota bacterium]
MKKIVLIGTIAWFLVSIATKGICQYNLVPNPSFELYDTCPGGLGQLTKAKFWTKAVTNVSPEFFMLVRIFNSMMMQEFRKIKWDISRPEQA